MGNKRNVTGRDVRNYCSDLLFNFHFESRHWLIESFHLSFNLGFAFCRNGRIFQQSKHLEASGPPQSTKDTRHHISRDCCQADILRQFSQGTRYTDKRDEAKRESGLQIIA